MQVPVEWAGGRSFGLAGIARRDGGHDRPASSSSCSSRSTRSLATARGLVAAALVCGLTAAAVFGAASLLVSALPAAVIGFVVYAAVLALWRPAGLRASWVYLRDLQ